MNIESHFQELCVKNGWQNWYQKFEVVKGSGVFTPGHLDVKGYTARMKWLELGEDFFRGKKVLDIGAFSGAFSFFLEDLGAEVLAIDVYDPGKNGFNIVEKGKWIHGLSVKFIHKSDNGSVSHPTDFHEFDRLGLHSLGRVDHHKH